MNLKQKKEKTDWGRITMFTNDDSSVRFAIYTYDDDSKTLYFSNLFVDDNIRRGGIGNEILNYVFDYAKRNSFNSIILNVLKDSWMQKWYERKGFRYIGDCDGEYEGNIWMIKNIKKDMIKTFEQFVNENCISLILEDHKFDSNPGEDFGENWVKLPEDDRIYNFVKSKFPQYNGKREAGIMGIYKNDDNGSLYYIAYIHGGENGPGEWKDYMEWMKNLFANFNDAWLLDLDNDVPDDVWTMRLAFREK